MLKFYSGISMASEQKKGIKTHDGEIFTKHINAGSSMHLPTQRVYAAA